MCLVQNVFFMKLACARQRGGWQVGMHVRHRARPVAYNSKQLCTAIACNELLHWANIQILVRHLNNF